MVSDRNHGGGKSVKDAYVGGFEVKVGCPERHVCCEISNANTEMAEFVNLGWAWGMVRGSVAVMAV